MPWFRVDDDFYDHPKVVELRKSRHFRDCIALWTLAGCWSARHLTDGFLPSSWPKSAGFAPKTCRELIRVGLWSDVPGGYQFHNWAERQPARSEIEERREKTRLKMADWRARKAAKAHVEPREPIGPLPGHIPVTAFSPDPSRPDPLRELRSYEGERASEALRASAPVSHAPARETLAPWPPQLAPEPTWTPDRQSLAFRKAYLAARRVDPAMGGKNVGDFHVRVLETAQARSETPEKLFQTVLERWLQRPLSDREKSAPYACFAHAFGELVDREVSGMTAEMRKMEAQIQENLRLIRGGRHNGE